MEKSLSHDGWKRSLGCRAGQGEKSTSLPSRKHEAINRNWSCLRKDNGVQIPFTKQQTCTNRTNLKDFSAKTQSAISCFDTNQQLKLKANSGCIFLSSMADYYQQLHSYSILNHQLKLNCTWLDFFTSTFERDQQLHSPPTLNHRVKLVTHWRRSN